MQRYILYWKITATNKCTSIEHSVHALLLLSDLGYCYTTVKLLLNAKVYTVAVYTNKCTSIEHSLQTSLLFSDPDS